MAVLFRVTALQSADEVHHSNRGHEEGKAEGQELHGDLLSGCIEATSQRQATFQILGNQKPETNVLPSGNSAPLFMRRGLFYFRIRQPRNVRSNPPCLIFREQLGR
jgi:hypothetical protein